MNVDACLLIIFAGWTREGCRQKMDMASLVSKAQCKIFNMVLKATLNMLGQGPVDQQDSDVSSRVYQGSWSRFSNKWFST